jgi:hypothetical protein
MSVKDFWARILDNITGMERRETTMNLSAAWIGKVQVSISRLPPTIERSWCAKAPNPTQ